MGIHTYHHCKLRRPSDNTAEHIGHGAKPADIAISDVTFHIVASIIRVKKRMIR